MEYKEASPLPTVCANCQMADCDQCDHVLKRWALPEKQQLQLRRKMMEKAIARYQRLIAEIDKQLSQMQQRG